MFDAHNREDNIYPRLMYISTATVSDGELHISTDNIISPVISGDESSGISPIKAETYIISPKRISDFFTIESLSGKPFSWQVVSLHGQVMKSGNSEGNVHISLADTPQGMYIIRLTNSDGEYSEKVIHI